MAERQSQSVLFGDAGGGEGGEGGVVTAVKPVRTDPGRVKVYVDRKLVADVPAEVAGRLGARVGAAADAGMMDELREAGDEAKAHRYALWLIGRQAMSRRAMEIRLGKKGYGGEVSRRVVDRLVGAGLIDDAETARAVVRATLARGAAGERRLRAQLMKKQVPRELADAAIGEALEGVDLAEQARELALRRVRTYPAKLDAQAKQRRLYGYLARRGFGPDVCMRATRDALKTVEQGSEASDDECAD